jgi:putative ABC transport system permease protein
MRRTLPGYFETMRIPLLEGRTFQPSDHRQRTNAVVISQAFARAYFPGENPMGRQVGLMFGENRRTTVPDSAWYTIVGIAGDTPVEDLAEAKPYPLIFLPPLDRVQPGNLHNMSFVVRSSVDPLSLVRSVRAAAAEINPNVALGTVTSMEKNIQNSMSRMAFTMLLLLVAGMAALLLGAVGIYGVISYVVSQRTGEIGVRMALGARPGDVARMVLRQSGGVVAVGLLLGFVAALALTRLMASLLFSVSPSDPLTYAAVTTFLLAAAGLASWIPARRAAALDPTTALRTG